MSYESFGGGSHGSHEWVAVDHQVVPQYEPISQERFVRAAVGGNSLSPMPLTPKFYVVRACQLCPEVWWQEYDPRQAVSA